MLPVEELRWHLHSLPERSDWIPYRTSYDNETWGFCLTHRQLEAITDDSDRVVIDSSLDAGNLIYGECLISGESDDEVLFSCHVCHPSLGNDNLSGMVVATMLAGHLQRTRRRLTYRVLLIPGTIGSITWLARNEGRVAHIGHGLVLAPGSSTRLLDATIGRAKGGSMTHSLSARQSEKFLNHQWWPASNAL